MLGAPNAEYWEVPGMRTRPIAAASLSGAAQAAVSPAAGHPTAVSMRANYLIGYYLSVEN